MAELLIKAEEPWNNDINTSSMTAEELKRFNSRSRKGDIIVVKPDGWKWGKEECPPRFVVVKLPGMAEKDAKYYEQPLMDLTDPENPVMLKVRKYATDVATVTDCAKEIGGAKEVSKSIFDSKLITKTAAEIIGP